jgi:negative regulator of sigma E activity
METNDLEFSITQYLDGNLPPAEQASLEARIKEDPQAQAMLAEHRRLTAALKAMPLPAVRWDALARSISQAVDAHEEQSARSYRMPTWVRMAIPFALAASVLIVVSVAVHYLSRPTNVATTQKPQISVPESSPSIIVIGPQAEKATGPAVVEVSIGPSAAAKEEPTVVQYSDDVVSRPSSVTIASGVVPAHDDTDTLLGDMQ